MRELYGVVAYLSFNRYFQASSYAMVACGTLTLFLSGGINLTLAVIFTAALVVAWKIEDSRWQLSERTSIVIVLLSLPLFYFDWKYQISRC